MKKRSLHGDQFGKSATKSIDENSNDQSRKIKEGDSQCQGILHIDVKMKRFNANPTRRHYLIFFDLFRTRIVCCCRARMAIDSISRQNVEESGKTEDCSTEKIHFDEQKKHSETFARENHCRHLVVFSRQKKKKNLELLERSKESPS